MKKFTSILEGDTKYWGKEAAGVLPFCQKTKRFLIALRSPYVMEPNTYGIFGGKLDEEEHDPKKVAIRELQEETEYYGEIHLKKAYIFEDKKVGFKYHNFIGIVSEEFEPQLNWENSDAFWLTFEELEKLKNKHFGLVELIHNSRELFLNILK